MTSMKNIMIECVSEKYDHHFIAHLFLKNNLALVKYVTLVPYLDASGDTLYTAYIEIKEWCDTESAYGFMTRLKAHGEVPIVYEDEDRWIVKQNNRNSHVGPFTKEFFDDEGLYESALDRIWELIGDIRDDAVAMYSCQLYDDEDKYEKMVSELVECN